MTTKRTTSDGLELLDEERKNAAIARRIVELREGAGLTQRQLAKRADTTASVICKLEDADYEGHSLSMLRRIAAALGYQVEVRFKPIDMKRKAVGRENARKPRSSRTATKRTTKTVAR